MSREEITWQEKLKLLTTKDLNFFVNRLILIFEPLARKYSKENIFLTAIMLKSKFYLK